MKLCVIALGLLFSVSCTQEDSASNLKESYLKNIPSVDSLYFEKNAKKITKILEAKEVIQLTKKYISPEIEGHFYDVIPDFLSLDSLKQIGAYDDYLSSLDIGQIRDANAFEIEELELTKELKGLIWGIRFSSYEACPFYEGTTIYLSVFRNNSLDYTMPLGAEYSVADPPMAFESQLFSKQIENIISQTLVQKEIEMDDEAEETITQFFKFNIQDGEFTD